jgi:hypothetical protein
LETESDVPGVQAPTSGESELQESGMIPMTGNIQRSTFNAEHSIAVGDSDAPFDVES